MHWCPSMVSHMYTKMNTTWEYVTDKKTWEKKWWISCEMLSKTLTNRLSAGVIVLYPCCNYGNIVANTESFACRDVTYLQLPPSRICSSFSVCLQFFSTSFLTRNLIFLFMLNTEWIIYISAKSSKVSLTHIPRDWCLWHIFGSCNVHV